MFGCHIDSDATCILQALKNNKMPEEYMFNALEAPPTSTFPSFLTSDRALPLCRETFSDACQLISILVLFLAVSAKSLMQQVRIPHFTTSNC